MKTKHWAELVLLLAFIAAAIYAAVCWQKPAPPGPHAELKAGPR